LNKDNDFLSLLVGLIFQFETVRTSRTGSGEFSTESSTLYKSALVGEIFVFQFP